MSPDFFIKLAILVFAIIGVIELMRRYRWCRIIGSLILTFLILPLVSAWLMARYATDFGFPAWAAFGRDVLAIYADLLSRIEYRIF